MCSVEIVTVVYKMEKKKMTVVCIGEFEMDSYLQKVATNVCREVKKKKGDCYCCFQSGEKILLLCAER